MRMRELKAISKHADGMSSDEEVPETEASAFRSQIGINIDCIIYHVYLKYYQM